MMEEINQKEEDKSLLCEELIRDRDEKEEENIKKIELEKER